MAKTRTTLKVSRAIEIAKAISMPGSLMNTTGGALDVRYSAANEADRVGIPQASRFEGLQVFQQDNKTLYILKDNSTANGVWEAVALGGSVAEDLANVINKITAIETELETIGDSLTEQEGLIAGLDKAIKDFQAAVESKTTEIEQAIAAVDTKVAANTADIDALKGRIDAAERNIAANAGEITDLERRTDEHEVKIDDVVAESAQNKADIAALQTKVDNNNTAVTGRLDAAEQAITSNKADADSKFAAVDAKAEANKAAIATLDGKVDSAVAGLEAKDAEQDAEIQKLKDAVSNKNNNTVVVDTFDELETANQSPKAGDLAYVVSEKKSYIYGEAGWIVFDEISSELDLVDYLKAADAEATYRKLADKIAKADLAPEVVAEIAAKADQAAVDAELAKKADKTAVDAALAGKADVDHKHVIADVTGLQAELDNKAAVGHKHVAADITDLKSVISEAIDNAGHATVEDFADLRHGLEQHHENTDMHVSAEQKQQLIDLGVKGQSGSLFDKVEALEAKKVEVDNKTIVRDGNDVISVKDGVFSKEGHEHTVADITDLDAHIDSKGFATQGVVDNHVNNTDIHVTKEQKDAWDAHRNNLGIHVQVGGTAPAPNTFGLWLDLGDEAIVGTFDAGEKACN